MQPFGLNDIRESFLSFFEAKDHLRLPSFPLVPRNDPSVLLVNAGMTPLKPYFTGAEVPPHPRVTTCQKCIRTPDIERVGRTTRHGTFFEMLGNFSFGDYFKEEIIPWAWEYCTGVLGLPPERLHVSVYLEDDEAYAIWRDKVGVPASRIVRLGKEDNFWEHGTGPCGPCSEIYFDRGPDRGCGSPDCRVGCDCDRYVEFWNLVFTQFNKEEDGRYTPLARRNIDTGAGLERVACILQDVESLFEVDTIRALLDAVCLTTRRTYGQDPKDDIAIRVITDHVRSTTMMIADGILPSNEGRGYVLRRLLRRAARFGRILGVDHPFLHDLTGVVVAASGDAYPELRLREGLVRSIMRKEEERFAETIQQGLSILADAIGTVRAAGMDRLTGAQVFRLHDTYGFPLDLSREIAAEQGIGIDEEGFRAEMDAQRRKAREALRKKVGSAWGGEPLPEELPSSLETRFVGYETLSAEARVLYLVRSTGSGMEIVPSLGTGEEALMITDLSPFYAESGGQVGDTGTAAGPEGLEARIDETRKTPEGLWLHRIRIESGILSAGDGVRLQVDASRRAAIARSHTATHLLHRALRDVLGSHVEQSGSLVTPDRLRFDYTHFQPLTQEERDLVEIRVNEAILASHAVRTDVMSLEEARSLGAMALFGEKYGDRVRVVRAGDYTMELCGGTHLQATSEALLFRILSETGVAAGIRRIEAVTGGSALESVRLQSRMLLEAATLLKTQPEQLSRRVEGLLSENRDLMKRLEESSRKEALASAEALAAGAVPVGPVRLVAARVPVSDSDLLRTLADSLRDRLAPSVILLAGVADDRVSFVAMASRDAVALGAHAGLLVKEAALAAGGGGGGRPDMAQAGGKDPGRTDEALEAARQLLRRQVKEAGP